MLREYPCTTVLVHLPLSMAAWLERQATPQPGQLEPAILAILEAYRETHPIRSPDAEEDVSSVPFAEEAPAVHGQEPLSELPPPSMAALDALPDMPAQVSLGQTTWSRSRRHERRRYMTTRRRRGQAFKHQL